MALEFGGPAVDGDEEGKRRVGFEAEVGEWNGGFKNLRRGYPRRRAWNERPVPVRGSLVQLHVRAAVIACDNQAAIRRDGEAHAARHPFGQFLLCRTAEVEAQIQVLEVEAEEQGSH